MPLGQGDQRFELQGLEQGATYPVSLVAVQGDRRSRSVSTTLSTGNVGRGVRTGTGCGAMAFCRAGSWKWGAAETALGSWIRGGGDVDLTVFGESRESKAREEKKT